MVGFRLTLIVVHLFEYSVESTEALPDLEPKKPSDSVGINNHFYHGIAFKASQSIIG